jgi:hypothetical protein
MKKILLLCLLAMLCGHVLLASHLRCGYITAERTNCNSRELRITITVYTNTASDVKFGEDGILTFGDGTSLVVPRVENVLMPDLGPNIGMATYTVRHIYGELGSYLISYTEPNRNGGVLNMNDSFFTTFYTETRFNLASLCAGGISFIAPPIFSGFTNSEITLSLGAASNANLTYEKVIPYRDRGLQVVGYWEPEGMSLNFLTGLLTWNTAGAVAGEYNFAVNAVQWGEVDDQLRVIGYTRIDFQVILSGDPPEILRIHDNQELDEYSRILVQEGETKKVRVFFEVEDTRAPMLEMFSAINDGPGADPASFITYDSISPPSGKKIKVGVLTIAPDVTAVRENAYLVVVRGSTEGMSHVSDINYLIYTDALPPLPEIITGTEDYITQVQVFPNPVKEWLTIQTNQPGESEVLVYLVQGVRLKTKTFKGETNIPLNDLSPGVYICEVRRNNMFVKRIKLIKD